MEAYRRENTARVMWNEALRRIKAEKEKETGVRKVPSPPDLMRIWKGGHQGQPQGERGFVGFGTRAAAAVAEWMAGSTGKGVEEFQDRVREIVEIPFGAALEEGQVAEEIGEARGMFEIRWVQLDDEEEEDKEGEEDEIEEEADLVERLCARYRSMQESGTSPTVFPSQYFLLHLHQPPAWRPGAPFLLAVSTEEEQGVVDDDPEAVEQFGRSKEIESFKPVFRVAVEMLVGELWPVVEEHLRRWGTLRGELPLNICCSEYGFCGTTEDFCGDKKVTKPSCPGGTSAGKKVIGYYEGWSTSKKCNGRGSDLSFCVCVYRGSFADVSVVLFAVNPEHLLMGAYTHLNYAFAFIDLESYKIANMQDSGEEYMPRLTALKNNNPSLEVWIAIGGWSMNDPDQPTKRTFSELPASKSHQDALFESLLSFMDKYGFNSVDIDWEYPVAEERSGAPEDFDNFISFLKNLQAAIGNRGLTITLPASFGYLQHFDIKNTEPILDWFNIMRIDLALELLRRNDIDLKKVVMGMGFYGRSFTLSNPVCNTPGCGFSAGGNPGKCSASAGSLMFSEIRDIIDGGGAQVVSYDDDDETLKAKMDHANKLCLGSVMVWAASTDDHKGTAIRALAKAAGRSPKFCGLLSKNRCTKTQSTDILDACKWFGAAPICAASAFFPSLLGPLGGALSFQSYSCGDDDDLPNELTKAKQGQGGQQSCSYNSELKSFCCKDPTPWIYKWRAGNTAWVQWENLLVKPLGALFFDFSTDYKTGCEPGETTPASPDLPDINLCYGPNHLDSLTSDLEKESNLPNVYDKEDAFNSECEAAELTALLKKRDTREITCGSNSSHLHLPRNNKLSSSLAILETSELLQERE
ncbi:hypothetical protein BDW59DRAFT_159698 [Aspergillus cavernicola]|uniref:chitinase n=1 Tax=Aspergillus cavernicola TaxID=176166 RepID=A0ABR4IMN9_9EURO